MKRLYSFVVGCIKYVHTTRDRSQTLQCATNFVDLHQFSQKPKSTIQYTNTIYKRTQKRVRKESKKKSFVIGLVYKLGLRKSIYPYRKCPSDKWQTGGN